MNATTAPAARIAEIDVVRGVAVLGILAVNMAGFAMPERASVSPAVYGGTGGADLIAWIAGFILLEGKMRGLFSLLFGASMLLVIEGAEAKGRSGAAVHFPRMAWLALFGAAHLYLVWWGDILLHYAILGVAAFLFRRVSSTGLAFWIAMLLLYQLLLMGSVAAVMIQARDAATAPGATAEAVEWWRLLASDLSPMAPDALARDLAVHRDSWWPIAEARWREHRDTPRISLEYNGAETLAYMLMGMVALRAGLLTGAWTRRRYAIVAAVGFGVGGIGYALCTALILRDGFDPATMFAAGSAATILLRPPMIIGYAALIVLLAQRGGRLVERLGAAGRAAFTNYLVPSLVMTTLFYGYGLGLYGRFDRADLWLLVLPAWALMLVWSELWLDRYRYGPFEWLWRTLARGRLQPMRRVTA